MRSETMVATRSVQNLGAAGAENNARDDASLVEDLNLGGAFNRHRMGNRRINVEQMFLETSIDPASLVECEKPIALHYGGEGATRR